MNYIDLFSGIGRFHLGLLMADFEFDWVGFSEIDKYAIKIYEKNFPDAESLGDITKINGYEIKERFGQIDLVTGGFPCQDISYAGKGAGITGSRSSFWKEMFRLICEIRPRYVIVENVPALLNRGFGILLGDLASCGYDAEWDCIPASAIGAHHQRDRIWIMAYPQKSSWNGQTSGKQQSKIGRRNTQSCKIYDSIYKGLQRPKFKKMETEKDNESSRSDICHPTIQRFPDWAGGEMGQSCPVTQFERSGGKTRRQREVEYDFCGMAHGISARVDRLKCLGNAVVPQVIEWIGKRIIMHIYEK